MPDKPVMITEIADYFSKGCGRCERFDTSDCSTKRWADGLAALRQICNDLGLEEQVKWGHPCYMLAGRNIALVGAFRGDFRLTFFNPALMKDPERLLEPAGPNSQDASLLRFSSNDLADRASTIRAYLQEAMSYADAGIVQPRVERELDLPDEMIEALDSDPELAEAFHRLTPGRQRSYAINLKGAKKAETRVARIIKFRDHIIAGKGASER